MLFLKTEIGSCVSIMKWIQKKLGEVNGVTFRVDSTPKKQRSRTHSTKKSNNCNSKSEKSIRKLCLELLPKLMGKELIYSCSRIINTQSGRERTWDHCREDCLRIGKSQSGPLQQTHLIPSPTCTKRRNEGNCIFINLFLHDFLFINQSNPSRTLQKTFKIKIIWANLKISKVQIKGSIEWDLWLYLNERDFDIINLRISLSL